MRPELPIPALEHTVDGRAVTGRGPELVVDDPALGAPIARFAQVDGDQLDAAVRAGGTAFATWGLTTSREERSKHLHRLADALEARREQFVQLIVAEAGTPITLTRALQVDAPLTHLRWYADRAAVDRTESLGRDAGPPASESEVAYHPVGVVAALSAYNYPLLLAVSKLGAALAAGCTVVLMPSPLAPLATLLIGEAAREADLPPGVLNVVVGEVAQATALTRHPGVAKVSFTGSLAVGTQVMRQAADGMKGVVLELGGKSPNLVLPGVGAAAVAEAVHLRYLRNAGQGCASPTRLLVLQAELEEFVAASREVFARVPVGDPWDPATITGPVITAAHRDRIQGYVDDAVAGGAEVLASGSLPDGPGWWSRPTLLGGGDPDARAVREEIFGPVGVVQPYTDVEDAVRIANDTAYGLGANVYGELEQARAVAGRIRAGLVTINGGGALRADGVFGGFGASGVGREHGEHGIREFLEPQHVQWAVPA